MTEGSAVISECGRYRYRLDREVSIFGTGNVLFVMLNPSTADATADDPTIRRLKGFATSWGFASLTVVNLFAWRATDPRDLAQLDYAEAVGPENDQFIAARATWADLIVLAWGSSYPIKHARRPRLVEAMLAHWEPTHLGLTKSGDPRHPLYLRADTKPELWREAS